MKQLFCLLLAACMMASLCACGKDSGKDARNDASSSNEESSASAESIPTPKEQETPGESEQPQASADGVDVDLTVLSSTMVYSEVYNMLYVWHTSMLSGSRRAAIIAQSLSESFSQKVGLTARNSYVPLSYSRCSSLECRTHCSTAENFANM